MADRTSADSTMSREELAVYLRDLADELDAEGDANVPVGNKTVMLHPGHEIDCDVTVEERSPMLGSESEAITVEMSWSPEG
jgi:amphi-Trp domain-containing protein